MEVSRVKSFLSRFVRKLKQYCSWENLNPLNWDNTEVKMFLAAFLAIMLPIYIFIGLQPSIPADAASYPQLEISSIHLKSPVATLQLTAEHELIAPAAIAGVYTQAENKLFIIGHSSTVFKKLHQVQIGDAITYNGDEYTIKQLETLAKSDISMSEILQAELAPTLILMTCAGTPLPNQDATHRLIITTVRD